MTSKIIICTVGGSPEPLITSLESHRPDKVLYVASKNSRGTIRQYIENVLSFPLYDTQILTLEDEQHLLKSVQNIRQGVSKALEDWQCEADCSLLADFTGGTKVMSAALVLALVESPVRFTYVGGTIRNKDGLGTVTTGNEIILPLDNPWDILALRELNTITDSFAFCQFDTVCQTAHTLAKRADEKSRYYRILETMGRAYGLWDIFQHKKGLGELRRVKSELAYFAMQQCSLKGIYEQVEKNVNFLTAVQDDIAQLRNSNSMATQVGFFYLRDILANAKRRGIAARYDDAVARLYSAIEKAAKIQLRAKYGINNSDVDSQKLPEHLRAEFLAMADDEGKIKIPLHRSFCLLVELHDPLGQRYLQHQAELERLLQARNLSLLAHGYEPVEEKMYTELFTITLNFLGVVESDLPLFPKFQRDDLIF